MMTRSAQIALFAILFLPALALPCAAQDALQPARVEYQKSDALIQTFILVAGMQGVRFTLVGASEDGVKSIRVASGEFALGHKECYGAQSCQISGAAPIAQLPSDIFTVTVISSKDKEQKERIKVTLEESGDKVYMITALPAFTGDQPLIIAGTGQPAISTPPDNTSQPFTPDTAGDKGPVITLSIDKVSGNEFTFTILATDATGVDFIEIMQNSKFFDVEICGGSPQCTMKKTIKMQNPGDYSYIIKSMNKKKKISFQEELITAE